MTSSLSVSGESLPAAVDGAAAEAVADALEEAVESLAGAEVSDEGAVALDGEEAVAAV